MFKIFILNNRENSQPDPTSFFFRKKKLTRNQSKRNMCVCASTLKILFLKQEKKLCSLKAKNDFSLSLLHVVLLDFYINRA